MENEPKILEPPRRTDAEIGREMALQLLRQSLTPVPVFPEETCQH